MVKDAEPGRSVTVTTGTKINIGKIAQPNYSYTYKKET
ncbi:hypothetical protein NIES2109_10100 [Nostoc sp. HK-01]|nr:hypothetical protein NIES2109_10100 [Nostoc sp. HK-01]